MIFLFKKCETQHSCMGKECRVLRCIAPYDFFFFFSHPIFFFLFFFSNPIVFLFVFLFCFPVLIFLDSIFSGFNFSGLLKVKLNFINQKACLINEIMKLTEFNILFIQSLTKLRAL